MISDFLREYGYYSFLAIGSVSMLVLTIWRRNRYELSFISAVCFPLILLMCGVLGAKLLFYIESGFKSFGGMSFFGAVYLVMMVMPLFGKMFHLKPLQTLDVCAPCVASIIGFMRFGCFCAGCCGGRVCNIGASSFVWPTQIIEGFGDILILALLLSFEQKEKWQGCLYSIFLIVYGILRFLVEFVRDTPKSIMGFSEGQWLAFGGIILGIGCIFWIRRRMDNDYCS